MRRLGFALLLIAAGAAYADDAAWEAGALWADGNPKFTEKGSRDFQSNGPMLRSIRVSKRELPAGETCASTLARVRGHSSGPAFELDSPGRFAGWDDFSDDRDAVDGCDGFPCKIKFNEPESLAIAAKPKAERLAEVLRQVENRVRDYAKTFRRKGYDLPEDAIDPWKEFPKHGHEIPPALLKEKPKFFARKLKFGEGNYRPLRQVFDERTLVTKDRLVRISRDVYTAHYFDGWGEWLEVRCAKDGKSVLVLQDLLMEFDLLKNTDFFSRIARPKMRQGVDQESLRYQKEQAERLFSKTAVLSAGQ
ncbi:MAG: hypothetical protein JST04_13295 [Bdellovibrionales bacterium]|nr:hypothetical protein [Bdellovibrionales bacterium]